MTTVAIVALCVLVIAGLCCVGARVLLNRLVPPDASP